MPRVIIPKFWLYKNGEIFKNEKKITHHTESNIAKEMIVISRTLELFIKRCNWELVILEKIVILKMLEYGF